MQGKETVPEKLVTGMLEPGDELFGTLEPVEEVLGHPETWYDLWEDED